MRNLNVELPGNLRQRPEVSPVSHRGNASPEELKSGEQWNSDVSIGYREDSNNPAEATGQPSNQLPADGKLSLRGQATENVQGEKTCTVTVTVRIVGTTPFGIDTEELKAFAVKMLSTKNPNLQQEEPVSTAVPGTSSCPPPEHSALPGEREMSDVKAPVSTRRRKKNQPLAIKATDKNRNGIEADQRVLTQKNAQATESKVNGIAADKNVLTQKNAPATEVMKPVSATEQSVQSIEAVGKGLTQENAKVPEKELPLGNAKSGKSILKIKIPGVETIELRKKEIAT